MGSLKPLRCFFKAAEDAEVEWNDIIHDFSLTIGQVYKKATDLWLQVGTRANVQGFKSYNYVAASVIRKILLAECATHRWGSPCLDFP